MGVPAPHYQIHIGGDGRTGVQQGVVGLHGPIVAARHAVQALRLLRQGYATGKRPQETVRAWAERLGKDGLTGLLAPIAEADAEGKLFIDWGDEETFKGAPTLRGECAAPFASDDLLADLADDAFDPPRSSPSGQAMAGRIALGRRSVGVRGPSPAPPCRQFTKDDEAPTVILERVRSVGPARALAALDHAEATRTAALSNGRADPYRESVAVFLDTVRAIVDAPAKGRDAAQ